jgi:methyltransferase (TIGR00027 family)
MQEAIPSKTALRVALRRAAHQVVDSPVVFADPLAIPILSREYAAELGRTPTRPDKPHSHALRAWMVVRSRYAEDQLAEAVARGVRQYCLLGAGLDTFAYRNPHPGLRVFEVDHPATQAWKRELLQENGIAIPESVTHVPVDFERQQLGEELARSGFDATQPTFFAWLGVVPYLTIEAFRATVAFAAAQPVGSGVVFDYGQPRHVLGYFERLAHDSLSARVAQAGEPFRLFFTPEEAAYELVAFSRIEDVGREELNALYFANRADQLTILGSAHIVTAWR